MNPAGTTAGSATCGICGQPFYLGGLHGHGICNKTYEAPQLTEADIRRIVREELERAKEQP